jgi:hypothetical protein
MWWIVRLLAEIVDSVSAFSANPCGQHRSFIDDRNIHKRNLTEKIQ